MQLTNHSHLFFHLQTGSTKRLLEIAAYLVGEHQLWKDLGLLCIRAAICFNIAPRPTEILRICQAWSKDRTQQPTPKVFFVIQYYVCIYIYIYLYMYISIINCKLYTISADPSRRDMEISYAGSKRCQVRPHPNQNPKSKIQNPKSKIQNPKSKLQNPKSKLQNPKSKIQTAPFGAATKRTKTKLIQNPKSKLQNPKSKIQDPKSKIPNPKSKIQNPKSKIQNPKSKIQNPKSKIQDPKSKIQNPKSKIQNPKSKIQNPNSKLQTPKSKIQNPNSKIQNPNGPFGVWILDFGFGRAGTGGDGYVANDDVWPCWPPEFGLVGGTPACNRKVAGSIPPTRGLNWAPISGGGVLPEIEPRFPAPCRGNRGPISGETAGQAVLLKALGQHRAARAMCVSARDVNITWHRPCVQMQETSTSHSIMDFCCVGHICVASEFFQQNVFLDKTIKYHIDYHLTSK